MINVQQVSSTLEQLSDQGLQQYAQMHKEDPYTLALAVSESARRQRMRQAAPSGQAGQPQGTVADEALVAMAPPPAAGLGAAAGAALPPAPGFADGGQVSQEESDRSWVRDKWGRLVELNKDAGAAIADVISLPLRGLAGAYDTAVVRPMRAAGASAAYLSPMLTPDGADVRSMTPFYDKRRGAQAADATQTDPNYENEPRREAPFWGPTATPAPAPAVGLAQAADAVLPPARGGSAGGIGISRTSSGPSGGAPQLDVDPNKLYADAEKQTRAATDAARTNAQQSETELQAEQAARGKLGAGREARIRAEQEGMAGKEAQAKRDALLQAGFAILSADPSKGAWSAIGTGALQGLQGYKGDMASLAKRREELVDKLDELDTLRRQEATADSRELRGIRSQIRQVEVDGAKALAAIGGEKAKLGAELKVSAFKELSANWRAQQQNATQLTAARIGASAGSRNSQDEIIRNIQASRPGMTYEQAYQVFAGSKRAGFDVKDSYAEYLKTPGATLSPMSFAQYSAQFGPPAMVSAPTGGQVLPGMK